MELSTQTDEALLAAFARGRDDALGALAARYEAVLVGLARGLLSGRDDLARDAVQDSWVRVIRFAKHFDGRSSVKTWLYRIVVNRCSDLRRRIVPPALNGTAEARASDEPLEVIEVEDRKARMRKAVDRMPGDTRLILLLCYHEGLSHAEASAVLEIPVGTLKSRLHAALESLRGAMASEARL